VKVSASARVLCLGALLAVPAAPALHAEAITPAAETVNPASGPPTPVGPVTGVPEYDSIGFLAGSACTPAPLYSAQPRLIGATTGNPERDTFGLVLEGEQPCAGPGATR
jgi:hypothetical protein